MKILQIMPAPEFARTRLGKRCLFFALLENNRGETLALPVFHADASDAGSVLADYARYCRTRNMTVETPIIGRFMRNDGEVV